MKEVNCSLRQRMGIILGVFENKIIIIENKQISYNYYSNMYSQVL